MESTLVSSRMARAKKDAGVAVLESIGATTSDLINSAFDYVIEARQLPEAGKTAAREEAGFQEYLAQSTLDVDWGGETRTYKQILREGKAADYEALA